MLESPIHSDVRVDPIKLLLIVQSNHANVEVFKFRILREGLEEVIYLITEQIAPADVNGSKGAVRISDHLTENLRSTLPQIQLWNYKALDRIFLRLKGLHEWLDR